MALLMPLQVTFGVLDSHEHLMTTINERRPSMAMSVFLSHAAADIELVRKVERHAKTLEVATYLYEDDPQAGEHVATKLVEAIRRSDAVIVLDRKSVV